MILVGRVANLRSALVGEICVTKKVWIIPAAIVILAICGVVGASKISLPTLTYIYDKEFKGKSTTAKFTVDGVKCYGTANILREHIEQLPGLVSLVAYGGRHRIVLEYDPQKIGPDQITTAIEQPITTRQGPMAYFKVVSTEVQ